ncbi:MAG: helix-turn-helix domain-containing protein, partial [Bacteriovoracales bacterium]|nr:helix-turn-helix domain-containing protein [Bacteriovoracales bacterium]
MKRSSKQNTLNTFSKIKGEMMQKSKPWLDENGNLRSDEEISRLGKKWPEKIWDQYLTRHCSDTRNELHENEVLSGDNGRGIENYSNERGTELYENVNVPCQFPELKKRLKKAIEKLSPKQRATIKLCLQGHSKAEAAKELGVKPSTVTRSIQRTFLLLETALLLPLGIKKRSSELRGEILLSAVKLLKGQEEKEDEREKIKEAVEYLKNFRVTG